MTDRTDPSAPEPTVDAGSAVTPEPVSSGDIAIGTVVVDGASGRVGAIVGGCGDRVRLRPIRSGREWDADPGRVRPATSAERLSAAVAAANAVSRGECV